MRNSRFQEIGFKDDKTDDRYITNPGRKKAGKNPLYARCFPASYPSDCILLRLGFDRIKKGGEIAKIIRIES